MILEMRDICKDYALGKAPVHVLKHVDLQVDHGEYVAIMGPSGSGKTTLMNLIGCLDVPTSGDMISWMGSPSPSATITSWPRSAIRRSASCSSRSTCCPG